MGLYLFCSTAGGCSPGPELAGVAGNPVEEVASSAGTLWVEGCDAPPEPSLETVRRHHAIVAAAWRACTACVPFRFGQWLPSPEALDERASEYQEAFGRALALVAGCGEFTVRVLDPAREPGAAELDGPAGPGRAYLEGVRRRRGGAAVGPEGEAVATALAEAAGPLARSTRVQPLPSPHGVITVTDLVERDDEEAYLEAVERVRSDHGSLRFLVSGPWPPYTFAP